MSPQIPVSDPGLQPERTVLAWGRTLVSFLVVSAVFLRWLPHYGWGIIALIAVTMALAGGIFFSQRRRYRRMAFGLEGGKIHADVVAVLVMTGSMLALGVSGIVLVLSLH